MVAAGPQMCGDPLALQKDLDGTSSAALATCEPDRIESSSFHICQNGMQLGNLGL
jgi:hypothetical protein